MEDQDEEFRKSIEAALKRAKNPAGAANVLALLFPKVERVLKTYVLDSMESGDRTRSRRISEANFAQSYFGLDPQGLVWSRADIEEIIRSSNPSALLVEAQRRIELAPEADRVRLRSILLDSLSGAFSELNPLTAEWLLGFLEASPYFIINRDDSAELFGSDNLQRMRWVIIDGVKNYDSRRRYDIFVFAIQNAQDLTLLSVVVRGHTTDRWSEAKNEAREKDFFGAWGDELRDRLLTRIREVVRIGRFWEQADPGALLWFWASTGFQEEVRRFTDDAMDTAVGLRVLLSASISLVRSSSGNYEQVSSYWTKVVDLEDLESRARAWALESSSEDQALAQRFLAALDRAKKER